MTIGDYIKRHDPSTYKKLVANFGFNRDKNTQKKRKKSKIKLGDSVENLMKHDSYKRVGRRIKQVKWE